MRSMWFYCAYMVITLGTIPVLLLQHVFEPGGTGVRAVSLWWLDTALRLAGIRLHADLRAIPKDLWDKPVVFMANHQSNFDIPLIMHAVGLWYPAFMAKQSLLDVPFFGACLRVGGHIGVDRESPRKAIRSIAKAVAVACAGRSLVVFPEGTRNKDPRALGRFRAGGAVIALRTGLPVVPLVLEGSADLLPSGRWTLGTRKNVYLRALPPVDPATYAKEEKDKLNNALRDAMEHAYQEMRTCVNAGNPSLH